MIKLLISLLLLFRVNSCLHAQTVESVAYSIMLKGLLSHSVHEVSVNEIGSDTSILFLDTREMRECEVSHIQHAVWVGYNDFRAVP